MDSEEALAEGKDPSETDMISPPRSQEKQYAALPGFLGDMSETAVIMLTSIITATIILSIVFGAIKANGDQIMMPDMPIQELYTGEYTRNFATDAAQASAADGRR